MKQLQLPILPSSTYLEERGLVEAVAVEVHFGDRDMQRKSDMEICAQHEEVNTRKCHTKEAKKMGRLKVFINKLVYL